jgi:glycosyltransferase involved in cell wall biosynthesis
MWYVSQIGRREHYALPAYLHRTDQLGLFATDIWAPRAASLKVLVRSEKLAQRFEASMGDAPVVSRSLIANFFERFRGGDLTSRWVSEGASFGKFAAKSFEKAGLGPGHSVIGYTAANLEQLIMAKNKGAKALHVQVDPGLSWYETRRQEQLAHSEAECLSPKPGAEFIERISREWQQADKVIVHSEHSRAALLAQGVDASRCVVVPPAFNSSATPVARRLDPSRPFRVLFVGNHCLGKGYHVFVDTARKYGKGVEFISVGSHSMRSSYLEEASRFVSILGHKSQAGVREQMERVDVLVFPTLSDGFGLVQLEAMAAGLPVIATSCCGGVVRHSVDGLIVPPRDSSAIVEAIQNLCTDSDKYERLSVAASRRPQDFSPELHFSALLSL